MTPKEGSETSKKPMQLKGESGETEEEATVRLLNEDPLDWMLNNEQVTNMLSVRRSKRKSFSL